MVRSLNYPLGDNIWFYMVTIAVLEALAIYAWQFRKMPGAVTQVIMLASKGVLLLSLVLVGISTELPAKLFWVKLQQITVGLILYLWFVFVLQVSQQEKIIPPVVKYSIFGSMACLWLAMLSNWHGLHWQDVWLDDRTIKAVVGPVDRAVMIYGYLLCILNTVLNVRWVLITAGLRRKQALWFTIAGLTSVAGHILWRLSGIHFIEPLPWAFLLSSAIVVWLYYQWRFYSILPLAQDVAARHMIDGLLVIDEQDCIVDMNPAARQMLNGLPVAAGGQLQASAAAWPALAEVDGRHGVKTVEAVREYPEGNCYYQLSRIPLQTAPDRFLGRIILLKDITRQKQDQAKMVEQEKALSVLTERERLGRELHDVQGQFPGCVKIQTQTIKILLQNGRLTEAMAQLESLSQAADASFLDVRESITGLKIAAKGWDFFEKLPEWLSQFQKMSGIATDYVGLQAMPARWILPVAEVHLLRIVQEILSNTRKHAGASNVTVTFTFAADRLVVTVEDDGCGFDSKNIQTDPAKFGLNIIRERAAEIGGICTVRSVPKQGTMVTVEIPLQKGQL